jgi:hypothetical protein
MRYKELQIMRGIVSGNSVRCQVGMEGENTYGTIPSMQRQIKIASEDFKFTPSKKQEGVLTGNIGAGYFHTMGKRTENSLSFLARPDDIGIFLKAAFGTEAAPVTNEDSGVTTHVFTPIGNGLTSYLPSLTFMLDKKTDVFTYNGCKINSISFSAAQEDFLNVELEIFGKDEGYGGTLLNLTPSPLRAFTFHGGKAYMAGSTTEFADITSINFSYNNNLENTLQTTSTGFYYKEPQPNTREINIDLEMLYSSEAETWRRAWFKTDDVLQVKLEFTSDELISAGNNYKLTLEIPACQVTECSMAVGDANGIKQSATVVGIDNSINTLITATLANGLPMAY